MRRFGLLAAFFSLLLFASTTGCKPAATEPAKSTASADAHDHEHGDEDHEHLPETFAAAVEELVKERDTIRDAFAKNDAEAAHEPLHEVGHLLEAMPELAAKGPAPADAAVVKEVSSELFELFGKVDEKLHGTEGATYDEVAEKIDAGVKRLQEQAGAASAPTHQPPPEPN